MNKEDQLKLSEYFSIPPSVVYNVISNIDVGYNSEIISLYESIMNTMLDKSGILDIKSSLLPLESSPVVYFLIHNNTIIYVGQSSNFLSRIGSHLVHKVFDSVSYIKTPINYLNIVEDAYIKLLKPSLNKRILKPEFLLKDLLIGYSKVSIQNYITAPPSLSTI